mmetsp:Transcript_28015/g.63664  ORF Transcript_28015/g.63664 Transcript_28015/m.63664 type:complete len:880 (-) Transcript_28015:58-2697(-)
MALVRRLSATVALGLLAFSPSAAASCSSADAECSVEEEDSSPSAVSTAGRALLQSQKRELPRQQVSVVVEEQHDHQQPAEQLSDSHGHREQQQRPLAKIAQKHGQLNETTLSLLARETGRSKEQVTSLFHCLFFTCMTWTAADRDSECTKCYLDQIKGYREMSVGVNSVSYGYLKDIIYAKIKGPYAKDWQVNVSQTTATSTTTVAPAAPAIEIKVLEELHSDRHPFFSFFWVDILDQFDDGIVDVKQCRDGAKVWQGRVKVFKKRHGGQWVGDSHGRRQENAQPGQWKKNDLIVDPFTSCAGVQAPTQAPQNGFRSLRGACRNKDGTGKYRMFKATEAECHKACADDEKCFAYERFPPNRCETHFDEITHTDTNLHPNIVCHIKVPKAKCQVKRDFPGPGTKSVMGWECVNNMLKEQPSKEWAGEWWRGNELGYGINNPFFWSSSGVDPMSHIFGALPSQHAVMRPIMEAMFTLPEPESGDARYALVKGIVEDWVREFLENAKENGLQVVVDLKVLVHQILNHVALGRNVTAEYAAEFVELQSEVSVMQRTSQIMPSSMYSFLDPMREKIDKYIDEYAPLIEAKYGAQLAGKDCSPSDSCARQAASMLFDTFYSIGGLSVPSTISTGIAILFSSHYTNPARKIKVPPEQAEAFYWENVRYFPPSIGFPHWERRPTCANLTEEATGALQQPDGKSQACPLGSIDEWTGFPTVNQAEGGERVVPNIGLAQSDPAKWGPDAHDFKLRSLDEYTRKSLGFAEGAVDFDVAGGAMNRNCPGKDLALLIGTTFFKMFDASEWAVPRTTIEFGDGPVFVTDFILSSKRMVQDCREVCPFCGVRYACVGNAVACQTGKASCSMCKNCGENPPSWWDLISMAKCAMC